MTEPNFTDFLGDPLSETTRKERRNLLLASTAGIAIATMKMVPTKLSSLGIDFSPPAQSSFLILVMVVVAYFFFAFITYGAADYFVWRKKYQDYLVAREQEALNWSWEKQLAEDALYKNIPSAIWLYNWHTPVAFTRLIFEFFIPIIAGVIAICLLFINLQRS